MALRERGLFGNRGSNQTLQTLFLIPIEGSHWQRQFVQFGAGISVSTIIVSHSCEFAFACYWCAKRRGTCKDFALNVGGRSVIAVLGCLAIIATSKAWAQAEDAEKEVTKQTTRQISNAVVGRVTAAETVGEGAINAWSTSSYNWISIRSSAPSGLGVTPGAVVPSAPNPNFGVGLFQQILGADTHIDRFVLGGSGAFSYTSANQGGITSDSSSTSSTKLTGASFSFSPYAAFLLNRNVFFTGLLGYTRGLSWLSTGPSSLTEPGFPPFSGPMTSTQPGSSSSSTVDTFFTDVAVNGLYDVPDTPLTLGARMGWRYQYSWSHVDADTGFGGGGSGFGSNTYYAAVEARYAIEAFIPYVRVQYEYAQPLSNPGPNQNNNALFLLAGFDYRVSPTFTAGLHFMTQEDNPSIRNRQLALNMRLVF